MTANSWLKITIPIQAIILLNQVLTGLGIIPLTREQFQSIHKLGGLVLLTVVLFHVILNWDWVQKTYFGRRTE